MHTGKVEETTTDMSITNVGEGERDGHPWVPRHNTSILKESSYTVIVTFLRNDAVQGP
jgi:hypothetical protein